MSKKKRVKKGRPGKKCLSIPKAYLRFVELTEEQKKDLAIKTWMPFKAIEMGAPTEENWSAVKGRITVGRVMVKRTNEADRLLPVILAGDKQLECAYKHWIKSGDVLLNNLPPIRDALSAIDEIEALLFRDESFKDFLDAYELAKKEGIINDGK